MGNFALEVVVDDVEDASHPEGVARVYQFVSPTVVPSELGLSLR